MSPPRSRRRTAVLGSVLGAAILLIGGIAVGFDVVAARADPVTVSAPVAVRPPGAPAARVGAGTHPVVPGAGRAGGAGGPAIAPGVYSTPGPPAAGPGSSCSFERLSGEPGRYGAVIASEELSGPRWLLVEAGDTVVLAGPCPWTRR